LLFAACGGSMGGPPAGTGGGAGGAVSSGGAVGSGGAVASGGALGSGGAAAGGGGGVVATGGARATGGVSGTGGGAGVRAMGGMAGGGAGRGGGPGGSGGSAGSTTGGGGSQSCPGGAYDSSAPPKALSLTGSLGAHDPAAYVVGSTVYLAATGLVGKTSTNLTSWTSTANPLPLPSWAASATGATNLWAPDISFFGGVYHLYYAASTFGSNKSCIGQATRAALDTGSWADQGMVVCSNMGETDNWNAIDPNVVVDDAGTPWLAFGSFWSGIKMIKLTAAGARADTMLYSLANGANSRGSLEGAWVFKRCGTYYLFTSWGSCCTDPYDYNIRVGRSATVTGPYVDKAGTSLMSGGGTLLVQGSTSWVAPGHNAVISYGGKTYNLYHALQGGSGGAATLRVAELVWDADGWPVSGGP
ncbi:MAG TPA: arabinan endo-1,5-alpha-L-arabinosidase, partial [Polyangia bacterium]|nr:arabinan endo-1,5-alpha-L-arabinosidase [Polyangia bacterium]